MKMSVICSAGGSTFFTAFGILQRLDLFGSENVLVITDRECGAEIAARSAGIETIRFPGLDNGAFSLSAARASLESRCDACLLLFNRLVTDDLFSVIPTYNIHPSLLPAYKGFGAVRKASADGVTILGATLHEVSEDADAGRIIAQVSSSIWKNTAIETMNRISFVQKVYLVLVLYEVALDENSQRITASASPALSTPSLIEAFQQFLADRPEAFLVP